MKQDKAQQEAPEGGMTTIFHTGKGHGPMVTKFGTITPGASLQVPAELAAKLCAAYRHIKLAKDVIPGITADPKVAEENAKLKAEIERLAKELEGAKGEGKTALDAASKEKETLLAQIEELKGRIEKFEEKSRKGGR